MGRVRNFLKMRRRYEWLRGTVESDGYRWNMRGLSDGFQGLYTKEDSFKSEILRPGELFVDVGAHTGGWSLRASGYYKTVIAFEPTPVTFAGLLKNLRINSVRNVIPHRIAISNFDGKSEMHHYRRIGPGGGGNSLANRHPDFPEKEIEKFPVEVRTLDSYGLKADVVKIDAEGSELDVLQGSTKTLQSTKKVIVEIHDPDLLPKVESFLAEQSFKTRVVRIPKHPAFCHVIGDSSQIKPREK